jgi:hypothetical protein
VSIHVTKLDGNLSSYRTAAMGQVSQALDTTMPGATNAALDVEYVVQAKPATSTKSAKNAYAVIRFPHLQGDLLLSHLSRDKREELKSLGFTIKQHLPEVERACQLKLWSNFGEKMKAATSGYKYLNNYRSVRVGGTVLSLTKEEVEECVSKCAENAKRYTRK